MGNETLNANSMTARQIARYFSLNTQYVRDLARDGRIPASKIGTSWRFNLKEVEDKFKQNAAMAVQQSLLLLKPTDGDDA